MGNLGFGVRMPGFQTCLTPSSPGAVMRLKGAGSLVLPSLQAGKATFQKKSRLDTPCNNFTPANFSLFRDVFRQNSLRIEGMTHREFSHLWTDALKVFAPEWCSSCVEQEGQDEKVVMWFEMLLEGTPEKCLSYAQTCCGLWNYILRDSLLWVFQNFQLNYEDFWKGLCLYLALLKLYQIVFPVNSSLGVSFEERSRKKKLGEQRQEKGAK